MKRITIAFFLLLLTLLFAHYTPSHSSLTLYQEWKLKLNVHFGGAEDAYRFKVFE